MRLLLALTALAAFAAANRGSSDSGDYKKVEPFGPGKEFVYIYDGQIASGIPGASEQHSVQRMQAKVHLVFNTEQTAVIKLRDVRVVAEQRQMAEPREVLPMRAFQSWTAGDDESSPSSPSSSIDQEKLNKLEKPVAFKYTQGIVSQLQFENDDPSWSTNVKRAVINLLQVNVKQHGRTDLDEENKLHNNVRDSKDYQNDFFTAYEKTLEGHCETLYTITSMPSTIGSFSSGEVLNITKSINFEKCKRRPQIKYNMRFAANCGQSCENEFSDDEKTVKSSTVIKMNISGSIERFAIEQAMVHSEYVFAPLADHSNVLITHVKAHLRLEKFGRTETRIPEPTGREKEELVYSPQWDQQKERFVMDGDDEFTRRSPYTEITNKAEAIEGVLRRMLRAINDPKKGVDHEATRQVARLVKLLRLCSEHDMQRVHSELFEGAKFDETDKPKVREILVDALALAGTKTTIEHLIKKIKQRDVSPARAAHSLKALVNIRVPSEKQIDSLLELCKDNVAEKSGALKQSCLLTAGSMINALCKDNQDKLAIQDEEDDGRYTQEKICSRQTKQKYVEKLWAFFEKAETRYEKVLALKALANAGLDVSIFKLEDLIRDFNEDKLVRSEAIDALRQLRSVMPKKIQKTLMPVFANRRELPSLRMQAFAQIMQTQPIERALLDQVAQFIYRERSQHVHAFVHSMMTTMANSTIPCEKQTAEDLQTSLRMARAPPPSASAMRSLYWHMPMFNTEQKLGATIRLGALLTNTSYLPVELMAGLDTLFMGDWVKNTLQLGVVQRDIEPVVERALRSLLQRGLDELVVRGKRSSGSGGFRPAEMLRDLFTKLGIQSRRGEGEQFQPYAMLYIRYKDMDYAVLPFDETTMPEAIKQIYNDGKLDISAIERVLAHGHQMTTHGASFVYETMKKFPTTMGIPLQVSNKMPLVASLKSHVTAELEPSNGRSIRGVRAKIIAQASLATTHVSKMELWWPLVNSGVKLVVSGQINLPINIEAEITSERAEGVKLTIKTPEQEKRILSLHTRPATFIRVWPKQARAYVDVQEKTIHHEQQNRISSVEGTYGKELLGGVELEVHCQWHRTPSKPIPGTPNSLLAGENLVEVFAKPHGNSKEIVITMSGELFARPDESTHKPEHGKFYDSEEDDSRSYERMDSREYEDEATYKKSKKTRRDNFEKYTNEYSTEKSYKHRLHMAMETSGKQKNAELELVATCDPQMRFCKLRAMAKRPAMLTGESRPWTLMAKGQTLYPALAYTLETLKQQEHREFNAEMEAEWGSDKKYTVNMRVQGEQSRRARQLLEEMSNKRDQYSEQYNKYDLLEKAAYLDQYKLETEYTVSPMVANVTYKLYNMLKAYQWANSDIKLLSGDYKQSSSQSEKRRLSAVWSIDPESRHYMNLSISSPIERVSFVDIALPVALSPLNIRRNSPSVHSFSQLLRRGQTGMSGRCEVDGKRVETFDDVEYKAKMTTCYVVLAKDCSDKTSPSFAVLMKKTEKSGEEKTIKIITQEKEIEIEMKKGEQKMKVKINGEHVREDRRLQEEFGIEKQEDGYKVEVEEAGIKVYFDGFTAQIKASDKYLASQCGLCGNYNGDRDDEWRMPSNSITNDFDEFRRSYDAEECNEYSKKGSYSKYNDEEDEQDRRESNNKKDKKERRQGGDSSEYDSEEPIKATAVVEQEGEICFSKQPIHICRDSSSMKQSKKQTVAFVCEPRTRNSIQKAREARHSVVEVSGSPSFSDSVRVAVKCEQSGYDRDNYEY